MFWQEELAIVVTILTFPLFVNCVDGANRQHHAHVAVSCHLTRFDAKQQDK
jgi:hypothetical protein